MKATLRLAGFLIVGMLIIPGLPTPQAAVGKALATVGETYGAEQSTVYLPLIGQGYLLLNDAVSAIEPTASSGVFDLAFDATPDPDANFIYFTATSAQGAGLFRVPAAGGEVVTLTVGAPLTMPFGLAINSSGQTVFVADPQAVVSTTNAAEGGVSGGLFSIPTSGGAPQLIDGTAHTAPRGLEVALENGVEMIYFTGVDPSNGQPAVMKVASSGGPLSVLVRGAPLVDPVGVAVGADGTIYLTDQAAAGNGLGSVFRIKGSTVETLASHFRTGNPAGVALTLDESLLLVSSLAADGDSSMVLVVNLANLQQGIVDQVIGANVGSGGLHRARNRNLMAWCGVTFGGQGTVYRVEFK